jgi:hypothetical protein
MGLGDFINLKLAVMAGLDPATQGLRVSVS